MSISEARHSTYKKISKRLDKAGLPKLQEREVIILQELVKLFIKEIEVSIK